MSGRMPGEFLQLADGLFVTMVGSAAAALTTISFLPQIIRGYRTKKMQDVSTYLMALYATGTSLWLAYGVFRNDWVIILANTFGTSFNLVLLYMKYRYSRSS
jgi:MtN3 and saliva related transmembrane protein